MKKAFKSFISTLLLGVILVSCLSVLADDYENINGAIEWCVSNRGSKLIETAGTGENDWLLIVMGRQGYNIDKASVIAATENYVSKKYQVQGKLSSTKATEWHRIALIATALGVDPKNFGGVDLIADGIYNRGNTVSLGKQGVNGWLWGLIVLDSLRFQIPDNSYYSRDDIIVEILRQQLSDGGFALFGNNADADTTAMAVIALSTYYNSETEYTYENAKTKKSVTKSVRNVIDESMSALSVIQNENGTYNSWGVETAESTAQVVVALCTMGINPNTDSRFIKSGNSVLDGLKYFKNDDGGYIHSYIEDSNNKSAVPGKSNVKATEQVLCALSSYVRLNRGMRNFYDMRTEQTEAVKNQILNLINKINNLSSYSLDALVEEYDKIPSSERNYVYNYHKLSDALKLRSGEELYHVEKSTAVKQSSSQNTHLDENATFSTSESKKNYTKSTTKSNSEAVADKKPQISETKVNFTDNDLASFNSLPDKITTENSLEVLRLLNILSQCDDFEGKSEILSKLNEYKAEINRIEEEIAAINVEIQETLYPFENLNLFDYFSIYNLSKRINSLADYDKTKIVGIEDLNRATAEVNSSLRSVVIFLLAALIIAVLIVVLTLRYKKRTLKKEVEQMLAERYDFKDMNL